MRHLLHAVGDAHAVQGAQFEGAKNEEIQRALQEIGRFCHAAIISTFDIDCQ
jgi:hypothetical protein